MISILIINKWRNCVSYYSKAGASGLINNEDVLQYIRFLVREAENPRNDGWVQKGYKDMLSELRDELNKECHSKA